MRLFDAAIPCVVEGRFDILPQCLLIVLDRKDIVAARSTILAVIDFWQRSRRRATIFTLHVEPAKELECIGNFQPLAARGPVSEHRLHAVAVLARPHCLAVDRDMLRAATLLQAQRAQDIGQSLCVDDARTPRSNEIDVILRSSQTRTAVPSGMIRTDRRDPATANAQAGECRHLREVIAGRACVSSIAHLP
jgi:hypothetical protein